eukprot:TRINITY_DN12725_c0_g1_i2.p1 TRINITY_DN12725_c0_g1~~TRINITY_DN12725_c0_g1_i2.p1  ORF type:complete len:336 (+),score=59.26 TRINITY_DN12725_c0_g1_i2:65-1009(+)
MWALEQGGALRLAFSVGGAVGAAAPFYRCSAPCRRRRRHASGLRCGGGRRADADGECAPQGCAHAPGAGRSDSAQQPRLLRSARPTPPAGHCPPGAESYMPLADFVDIDHHPLAMHVPSSKGGALLPPQRPEHRGVCTVVLDLDETLVHHWQGSEQWPNGVLVRQGALQLVAALARECEVVVWTAGVDWYARKVCALLDPHHDCIAHLVHHHGRWYRPTSRGYCKDLRLLGRALEGVLLVDNSPCCAVRTPMQTLVLPSYVRVDCPDDDLHAVRELLLRWLSGPLSSAEFLAQNTGYRHVPTSSGQLRRIPYLR